MTTRPSPMLRRLLFTALLALAFGARADDPDWYQIDVIVFANTDTSGAASETWPADPGMADLSKAVELAPADAAPAGPGPVPYQLLPEAQDKLDGVYKSIARSRLYRPLLRLSWRQPVMGNEQAVPVHIHGGTQYPAPLTSTAGSSPDAAAPADAPAASFGDGTGSAVAMAPRPAAPATIPEIDGTITISRARYLHAWADLTYTTRIATADDPTPTLQRFRMKQHRRMRSGEIHYLDHPMFGVVLLATPYEVPKPPAPKPTPAPTPAPAPAPPAGGNN